MRIGLLCEGLVDLELLPALLQRVARSRAGITWPLHCFNAVEEARIRTGSFGQIPKAVKNLLELLHQPPWNDCDFFVILLDAGTRSTEGKIRKLIRGHGQIVMAVAIKEIEAWWLGDRTSTLEWLGLVHQSLAGLRYGEPGYQAEKDSAPKKTLDELTECSPVCTSRYGDHNVDIARNFAEYWRDSADLSLIEKQCPAGFRPFCRNTTNALRRARRRARSARRRRT